MIGIFDSGLGGLSIYKSIVEYLPTASTIYLADQKFAPYGDRSTIEIQQRGIVITRHLEKLGATTIVIACNTATVNVTINHLREIFPQLVFVGVEPPIKILAEKTQTNKIALFATPRTCASARLKELITLYATSKDISVIPTKEWANLVEKNFPEPETTILVNKYVERLDVKVDYVGLGCTHYPFLKPWLEQANSQITWIDVADAVARRVKTLYLQTADTNKHLFLTTSPSPRTLKKALTDLLSIDSPVESIQV